MYVSMYVCICVCMHTCIHTVQYKTLEGEKHGEFGELQEIFQNFLVQKFSPLKQKYIAIQCIVSLLNNA